MRDARPSGASLVCAALALALALAAAPASGEEKAAAPPGAASRSVECPPDTMPQRGSFDLIGVTTAWCVDADGQRHGPERSWYSNGRLGHAAEFRRGARHGRFQQWDEQGRRRIDSRYVDGKPQGTWRAWHGNGQLASVLRFDRDGKLAKTPRYWDPKGRPLPPPADPIRALVPDGGIPR